MKSSRRNIITGMIWAFSERMAAQTVSVIVGIVLARILGPSEYGVISLVAIFIAIANVFVTDGFGVALIQKDKADQIDFSTVFFFGIFFSLGMYGVLFFLCAPAVSWFYDIPILLPVLRVLSLKVPIAAINSVQQAYVSRNMLFRKFFWSTLIGTVISAVVGIAMACNGYGVWALVAQELTNTVIDTLVLWITVKWRPVFKFSFQRLRALFSYGWKLLVQALLNTIYGKLRSLVIGKVYTPEDLSFYSKGSQYPNLIVTNVDTAMGKVLFPAMAKEQDDFSKIRSVAQKSTSMCSFVMEPMLIGFAACGEILVSVVFTDKWLPMVPYLRIICFVLLIRPAQTAMLQALKATGRSDRVLKIDIPVRIVGLLTLVVSAKLGVIYFAISELFVEYFGLLLYSVESKRVIDYGLKDIVKDLGANTLPALIMGVCVYLFGVFVPIPKVLILIIQIIGGMGLYIVLCKLMRNKNLEYVWDMIRNAMHSK